MDEVSYALITPARNEAATLAQTIEAVLNQTIRPRRWVIVSDASTDGTDEIVRWWSQRHPLIVGIRLERDGPRDSSTGKMGALLAGYREIEAASFEFLGQLDADVTFEPTYFEALLARFRANPNLGIGGGVVLDCHDGLVHTHASSVDHVAGAVQLYRRACYESIAPYNALRGVQEDTVAEYLARWQGWETRSFPDLRVLHHRRAGTAGQGIFRARYRAGVRQYLMGWSPVYVVARSVYCLAEPPRVCGALVRFAGYLTATIRRHPRELPAELVQFIRGEQRRRIWSKVSTFGVAKTPATPGYAHTTLEGPPGHGHPIQ